MKTVVALANGGYLSNLPVPRRDRKWVTLSHEYKDLLSEVVPEVLSRFFLLLSQSRTFTNYV